MWPAVELRELHVFLTVAEELHFGRAAERLDVNASRVSQVIRELEGKLGGRLFDRTSRRVHLTALGEDLHRDLKPIVERLQAAVAKAHEAATGVAGTLRIGSYSPMVFGAHWMEIINAFTSQHPDCDVAFVDTGLEREYLDWLRAGEVDLLGARLPLTEPDLTIGPILTREPRVLGVAERDPLAARESISYEELADRAVSDVHAFPREMMDSFIPPHTPSGRPLRRIPNRTIEEAMMRVATGTQVHPTVPSWLEYYKVPGVATVPINDLPPSETALVWLTSNRSRTIRAFIRAAEEILARAGQCRCDAG
jgi:DNA-binding transcriptional LysR family regulator